MKTNPLTIQSGVSEAFSHQFGQHFTAMLSGFDRRRFRATQRLLLQPNSMESYLATCKVLLKTFRSFAEGITRRVKAAAYQTAAQAKRPVQYLGGGDTNKAALARQMDRAQIGSVPRDNCFPWVEDPAKAPALLVEPGRTDWPKVLHQWLTQAHPLPEEIGRPFHQPYYKAHFNPRKSA